MRPTRPRRARSWFSVARPGGLPPRPFPMSGKNTHSTSRGRNLRGGESGPMGFDGSEGARGAGGDAGRIVGGIHLRVGSHPRGGCPRPVRRPPIHAVTSGRDAPFRGIDTVASSVGHSRCSPWGLNREWRLGGSIVSGQLSGLTRGRRAPANRAWTRGTRRSRRRAAASLDRSRVGARAPSRWTSVVGRPRGGFFRVCSPPGFIFAR